MLEQNYMQKMVYSPDYLGVDKYQALEDFKQRIAKYEEVYETITNRDLHYIKLIDMCARGLRLWCLRVLFVCVVL